MARISEVAWYTKTQAASRIRSGLFPAGGGENEKGRLEFLRKK